MHIKRLAILLILLAVIASFAGDTAATSTLTIDGTPYTVVRVESVTYSSGVNGEAGQVVIVLTTFAPNGILYLDYSGTSFSFSGNYSVIANEPTLDGGVKVTFNLVTPNRWSRQ